VWLQVDAETAEPLDGRQASAKRIVASLVVPAAVGFDGRGWRAGTAAIASAVSGRERRPSATRPVEAMAQQ
jgi:hypothetical protein